MVETLTETERLHSELAAVGAEQPEHLLHSHPHDFAISVRLRFPGGDRLIPDHLKYFHKGIVA